MSDFAKDASVSLADKLFHAPITADQHAEQRKYLYAIRIALVVAVSYFIGSKIGFATGMPRTLIFVFWPPNVILLSAFLLTPRRDWWVIIAAGMLAEFLAFFPAVLSVPIAVTLIYYVTNAGQALVAAILIQRYCGGLPRFDDFLNTARFIAIAAFLVPGIVSLLVALALAILRRASNLDMWLIFQARFLTEILTTITLAPLLLLLLSTDLSRLRRVSINRFLEAVLLAVSLIAVEILVLGERLPQLRSIPALLYAPLPVFLWAAIRFGVRGVSGALLVTAIFSLYSLNQGEGLFFVPASSDSVLALQLFLIELGLPLILMAALLDERRMTVRALREGNQQIHSLAGQLITAQEEERRRVARELHDQVGQALTAVKINLDTLRLTDNPVNMPELLNEGTALVDHALEQVRDLSLLLRPSMLDDLGLEAALRSLSKNQAKRVGYRMTFTTGKLQPRPPREIETICYRVTQEALTNIARHARAHNVSLDLQATSGMLRMIIRDDGCGFDPVAMRRRAERGESMGLLGMQERAKLGGGHLQIDSTPGRGTMLALSLPCTISA